MIVSGFEPHSLGDLDRLPLDSSESDEDEIAQLKLSPKRELDFIQSCSFSPSQEHENDEAEIVLVSEPEAASITMGGLHPRASLYERPVNLDSSKKQHYNFRKVLRSHGIKVLTVRGMLAHGAEKYIGARVELEELAMHALTYTLSPSFTIDNLSESDKFYLTDTYKRQVLEEMCLSQLIDVLLLNPTVELSPSLRDTGFHAKYEYQPLSNLIYTRDQQITTCKGIVMGRLKSQQRQREVELLAFCFQKLGIPLLGSVSDPGYLEGGDFYPAGRDLCFIGVGLRSNLVACEQLMEQDWFGTERIAVVIDAFDQHQDRMHLDCVFNIVSYDVCLMLEDIIGEASPLRRTVTEFTRDGMTNKYRQSRSSVEFSLYVQEEGYKIIKVNREEQLKYACNVLNLGNAKLISVNVPFSRQMVRSSHFDGSIEAIEFSSITSMYGAVHCSSQVLKRRVKTKETQKLTQGTSSQNVVIETNKAEYRSGCN
eukprot:g9126.t1